MTDPSPKAVLERLGLKQAELATLLDVSTRSVNLWATGSAPVPGPVAAYLRVLSAAGQNAVAEELRTLGRRSSKLDEGIYALTFWAGDGGHGDGGEALAVLRNGSILGSDRGGAVFTGSYAHDPDTGTTRVHVRLSVPPDGTLVTGFTADVDGAILDIVAAFERATPVSTAVVDAAGRPITLRLEFLGALRK